MFWPPRSGIRRRLAHRLLASLALVCYCAASFGFPMPARRNAKDTSQPFPCQDHVCGCRSAEECWRSCCCMSATERWAWAHSHEVEPPHYAERPDADGWRSEPLCTESVAEAGPAPHDCCKQPAPREPPRCEGGSCCHEQPAAAPTGFRWTLGVAAPYCHPVKALWVASGAVLPPAPRPEWNPYLIAGEWLSLSDRAAWVLSSGPLDPPPRAAAL